MSSETGEERVEFPDYPLTDETGDVDLTLLAENLRLQPWERAEKHYRARMLAQALRRVGREHYGELDPAGLALPVPGADSVDQATGG